MGLAANTAPSPEDPRPLARLIRAWFVLPRDPTLLAEHRRVILIRTRVATIIAALVMPFTILLYLAQTRPELLGAGAAISIASSTGSMLVLSLVRFGVFDKYYQLPFVLLVGVVCYPTEALVITLTGGAAISGFFFPYFLVLFGTATMFPSSVSWAVLATGAAPVTYAGAQLLTGGDFGDEHTFGQLILLIDTAFIAVIANRVTTRLFFSEVENRRALEAANERLRDAERARSEFFAGISHDLRSPLSLILAPLSAVHANGKNLTPQQRHYVDLARGGAARLDTMINDLLDLARIDGGVKQLDRTVVDLRKTVAELCDANGPHARGLGLELVCDLPPNAVYIGADPGKLDRVLMNLLSNACKFSGSQGEVRLSLDDSQDDHVTLTIKDQGRGIPPQELPTIFNRFARGQLARDERLPGAGLGLAVVKEFVVLHGGEVSVQSEPGKGSTFCVKLPRALDQAELRDTVKVFRSRPPPGLLLPARAAPKAEQRGPLPRLLLVEDSDELRGFLSTELSDQFDVAGAGSGEEALSLLEGNPVDAVITDVMLPGIDGLEVCRTLRRQTETRNLPVLVFSARGNIETRLEAFSAGADDFINKPFDPLELRARITSMMRRAAVSHVRSA